MRKKKPHYHALVEKPEATL